MDKHHENKLTMYLGVKSVLEENVLKTDTLPALGGPIASFKTAVDAVARKSKEFDLSVTGKTRVKLDAEEELIAELMPAVSSLAAYAHLKKDTELWAKASVTESTIRRLRDTEIVTKAMGLCELVEANVGKLAEYGVTPEGLVSLRARIDGYAAALGKKESGYSDRSSTRQTLFGLFDEADTIPAKQIDPLMEQFRKKEAEFYNSYFDARYIRNMGAARKPVVKPTTTVAAS